MEKKVTLTQERVKRELTGFPPVVTEEFEKAWGEMSALLNEGQLAVWAQAGMELAQQAVRSWEAANQYFMVSPKVAGLMPFSYFVKWSQCGSALCRESPALAASYFQASPDTMGRLRSRHIEAWADLGGSLYKGTWKSGTLSSKFFEAGPALLANMTVPEVQRFVALLDTLSHRSYDLSLECLSLGQKVFRHLGDDKEAFIALASSLSETSWRQVKGMFEAASTALPNITADQRLRFLTLVDSLSKTGSTNVPVAMLEVSQSLSNMGEVNHARVLDLAEALLDVSPAAMPAFIKSCPTALDRVTLNQLEKWFEEGVRILEQNNDGGMAYFRLESAHSQEMLELLSSSVEFGRIKDLMELYCRALAGAEVALAASEELAEKNIGWVSGEAATTEGSTVFVPSHVDRYPTKADNFGWFKVVSTHQVAHLEFGSFRFEYDRPSALFKDLRPRLSGMAATNGAAEIVGEEGFGDTDNVGIERAWVTDMQQFFDLFQDRSLALDVFTVVEDGRLDARVKAEYQGIKGAYLRVQGDSLAGRPQIESLPMREAMLEFLVRLSLQQYKGLPAPSQYVAEARKIAGIAKRVLHASATVEDTAEATLRIYAILSAIPNEKIDAEDWQDVDVDEEGQEEYADQDDESLLQQLMQGMGSEQQAGEAEQDYEPSEDVEFRGEFKPELVQLLTQLRMQQGEQQGDASSSEAINQEMVEEMLKASAEMDLQAAQGEVDKNSNVLANNMLKEAGLEAPKSPEFGQGPLVHVDEEGGALDSAEPQTFVYDEWDFRADDYKPNWCVVRQKGMAEGDAAYYGGTLHSYAPLVNQVKRQFELMVPEMMRKVRKLEDGEEIDIDDVIEAMVDIRTGVGPSEKLFWRRNKIQRDVAVVFLLDTSASTAEAIEDSRKVADDWEAPDDPVEYMVWLRTRRSEGMRRSYKRIIDLEKEAVVLLINALEAIGDVYGIYGFSGYGRENVKFYNIKDIDETFSDRVKKRIDRIAPLHATRMGPAIRHATTKLENRDARTKLLFLISDGRPQDRGYSREGVEKEYAVHDTKMALDEARDKEITAFCLTVDKNGHDYLKTMCEDIGYEVLDDIYELPRRLLHLYRRLTM